MCIASTGFPVIQVRQEIQEQRTVGMILKFWRLKTFLSFPRINLCRLESSFPKYEHRWIDKLWIVSWDRQTHGCYHLQNNTRKGFCTPRIVLRGHNRSARMLISSQWASKHAGPNKHPQQPYNHPQQTPPESLSQWWQGHSYCILLQKAFWGDSSSIFSNNKGTLY